WWHPVVWWARRELGEAEEQCCDAWVLWAMPGASRRYALALVETLDFLSEARPALPVAASGLGQVHDLRRRLTMIMRGTTPRRLSWTGLLAVAGAAALLLPLGPTLAQQPAPQEDGDGVQAQRNRAEDALHKAEMNLQKARSDAEVARARAKEAEVRAHQER